MAAARIPVYDTLISLLISVHNGEHQFVYGFATAWSIAMKFLWHNEDVSCLRYENFEANLWNFTPWNLQWYSNFLLNALVVFRPRYISGSIQQINIFCIVNYHLHTFYTSKSVDRSNHFIPCHFVLSKFPRVVFLASQFTQCDSEIMPFSISSLRETNHVGKPSIH